MLKRLLPFLTLFTSLSTLVCCALPALFVSVGFGATLVSVLGTFPQLIWLSEHKLLVFGFAGSCLLLAGVLRLQAQTLECPTDLAVADSCKETKVVSSKIFYVSVILYLIGAFFAFAAPIIFNG